MLAVLECWECNHIWEEDPGPSRGCLKCGHLYMTWLNYDDFKLRYDPLVRQFSQQNAEA